LFSIQLLSRSGFRLFIWVDRLTPRITLFALVGFARIFFFVQKSAYKGWRWLGNSERLIESLRWEAYVMSRLPQIKLLLRVNSKLLHVDFNLTKSFYQTGHGSTYKVFGQFYHLIGGEPFDFGYNCFLFLL
jgi:hypothetical protein